MKIAIVTGASSGMGKAIVELFVKEGADVIAVANDGKITAAEIKALATSFAEAKQMWDED